MKEPYIWSSKIRDSSNNDNTERRQKNGWTAHGIRQFNRFYNEVKTDRRAYGKEFNKTLRKVIVEFHEATNRAKRKRNTKDSAAFPVPVLDLGDSSEDEC